MGNKHHSTGLAKIDVAGSQIVKQHLGQAWLPLQVLPMENEGGRGLVEGGALCERKRLM